MVWPEPPNYYEAPKHGFKVRGAASRLCQLQPQAA
jgi:hypothetical protein